MRKNDYLTISEFSRISEISRRALIFYDNIGLFSPEHVGENGYRYYSHEQIYIISVINILKELGMPLDEIKSYMQEPSPSEAVRLLEDQEQILTEKIERLRGIQNLLNTKKEKLKEGLSTDISKIRILHREETPLFISDAFDAEKTEISDDIWLNFYLKCKENHIAFGYPEGFLVNKNHLLSGKTFVASHIICHVGKRDPANGVMPGGTYLTGWGRGGFDDTEPVYHKLLKYAQEKRIPIIGNAYEERLIDEVGAFDKKLQIIQVSIQVRCAEE